MAGGAVERASSKEKIPGRGLYLIFTRVSASSAIFSVSATTIPIGSPTYRTLSWQKWVGPR